MAIEIKEYLGATFSLTETACNTFSFDLKEAANTYLNNISKNSKMVDIEGLHSIITRNDTLYTDKAMIASEKMWTNPYEIPVIMHHNEEDGIIIGRVKHAYWTDKNTRSNTGALRFITNIAHKDGIEGVNNGTLCTVSVGVLADDVRCSICGQNIATHGLCEHEKGAYYDEKKCYWIVNSFEPKELSFVIVPSDPYAHIVDIYEPETKNKKEVKEMYQNPFQDILDEEKSKLDLAEAKNKTKKDEEKPEEKEEETTQEGEENDNIAGCDDATNEENKEEGNEKEAEETEVKDEGSTNDESNEEVEKTEEAETKTEESTEEKSEEESEEKADETNEKEADKQQTDKKEINEEVKKDIEIVQTDIYKNMESALAALKSENEVLKKEVERLNAQVDTEVKLKEAAENKVIEMKTATKKALVEKVMDLRESMKLEKEDEANLMKCNEEALNMTLKNLQEFSSKIDVTSIPKIKSEVAITESRDNTQKKPTKNVKEHKQASNMKSEGAIVEDILKMAFGNGQ